MGRKVLVIINPVSGTKVAGRRRERLEQRLAQAGVEYEVRETQGAGDALRWAREAQDVDLVIAFGGDGTIMEAMSGLIEGGRSIPLAQLPAGTANLLARALGIPTDLDAALEVALDGVAVRHDVGYLKDRQRYFALIAGAGFDARLMEDTPRELKNRLGFLAYLLAASRNLFRLKRSNILLEVDGRHHHFSAHTILAINVGEVEGLRLRLAKDINPHDGKLDLAIVTPASLGGVARLCWHLVRGQLDSYHDIHFYKASRARIEAHPPLRVEIDGEPIGETPLLVEAVPDGALFVVPPAYAAARALAEVRQGERAAAEELLGG